MVYVSYELSQRLLGDFKVHLVENERKRDAVLFMTTPVQRHWDQVLVSPAGLHDEVGRSSI